MSPGVLAPARARTRGLVTAAACPKRRRHENSPPPRKCRRRPVRCRWQRWRRRRGATPRDRRRRPGSRRISSRCAPRQRIAAARDAGGRGNRIRDCADRAPFAPPSVPPGIFPQGGDCASRLARRVPATSATGETGSDSQSPPRGGNVRQDGSGARRSERGNRSSPDRPWCRDPAPGPEKTFGGRLPDLMSGRSGRENRTVLEMAEMAGCDAISVIQRQHLASKILP